MIHSVEAPGFIRAFKKRVKRQPDFRDLFRKRLTLFLSDPHHPSLETHKLHGKLKHSWAFSIDHHLRVVFSFLEQDLVLLEDIGTHDEIYE
jgi:mRNA-degrading endonuclease YafQ of YafQ-DinJ toxin-antitoxin module